VKLNRTQLTISGILLTLALILTIIFSRKPAPLVPATGTDGGQPSNIRDLVDQPVTIKSAVEKQSKDLPVGCSELWSRITEGSAEQFRNFSDDDKSLMKTCSDAVPFLAKHDPGHLQRLRTSCSEADEEGSNAMQGNCALYYLFYKAGLVTWFNKDKSLQDLRTDELALLFFHEYNNLDQQKLPHLSQLADELVTRTGSYSALKAKASIQLFQFMKDIKPAKAEELIRTVKELETRNPHDEQLLELHFVALAMQNDLNQMNQLTENFVKSHPSSATGYYIRSAYFWQIKDRAQTIELLKNAVALEPQTARFSATRDQVEVAEPGASGVYNIDVNFDLMSE